MPEKELMVAVVDRAIKDMKTNPQSSALYREAERWIMNGYGSRHVFSFESICDSLGLDVDYMRKGIADYVGGTTESLTSSNKKKGL